MAVFLPPPSPEHLCLRPGPRLSEPHWTHVSCFLAYDTWCGVAHGCTRKLGLKICGEWKRPLGPKGTLTYLSDQVSYYVPGRYFVWTWFCGFIHAVFPNAWFIDSFLPHSKNFIDLLQFISHILCKSLLTIQNENISWLCYAIVDYLAFSIKCLKNSLVLYTHVFPIFPTNL